MGMSFELLLIAGPLLILLSILASKLSSLLGVPSLLLFLLVGMLAGSEGFGGIHFNDPRLVQSLGVIALVYILFSGGLDTNWKSIKPVLGKGMLLSTFGVLITAVVTGWFSCVVLDFSLLEGFLLGAIVSSTDAAAVFTVLRSRRVSLRGELKPLLELESGSNDPMAVFLTTGFIMLLNDQNASPLHLVPLLVWQMACGTLTGYLLGKGTVYLMNRLQLEFYGLYSVLSLTLVLLNFGVTSLVAGNGFLSVYVAGLVIGNSPFIQKRSLVRFHDGLAWLMQIAMFLTLGLQIFPSHLVPIIPVGLLVAGFLMFIARPLGVFVSLSFARVALREKVLISWVGLRGAVPIVLATFPLLAGIAQAEMIFNVVFFIVLSSAVLQGASIPFIAKLLNLEALLSRKPKVTLEFEPQENGRGEIAVIVVPDGSAAAGRQIVELGLPEGALVVLVERGERVFVPGGGTVLLAGDMIHLLADRDTVIEIERRLEQKEAVRRPGR